MECRRSRPAISTATGTQKWMSVRMLVRREGGGEEFSIFVGGGNVRCRRYFRTKIPIWPMREMRAGKMPALRHTERGLRTWGAAVLRPYRMSTGPDACGEGADGGEVEFFVELDGGAILRGDREREFAKFHGAQRFGGSLHEHAAEAVALVAGEDADLRGVADAWRDFAGEHGGDEFVAARLAQNEGSAGNKLSAAGKQDDVLEEAQGAGAAAVLVVDLAIDVIGVGQINQFGARLEKAVIPAIEAHARGRAGLRIGIPMQIEEHELAGVQLEALLAQGMVHRTAEGHELRFDARQMRKRAHGEEHFFEQAAADIGLRKARGDVQAAD